MSLTSAVLVTALVVLLFVVPAVIVARDVSRGRSDPGNDQA